MFVLAIGCAVWLCSYRLGHYLGHLVLDFCSKNHARIIERDFYDLALAHLSAADASLAAAIPAGGDNGAAVGVGEQRGTENSSGVGIKTQSEVKKNSSTMRRVKVRDAQRILEELQSEMRRTFSSLDNGSTGWCCAHTWWILGFGIVFTLCWGLGLGLTCGTTPQKITLACALAPFGAGMRYFLGIFNKRPTPGPKFQCLEGDDERRPERHLCNVSKWKFPFYTFLANMIGTATLSLLRVSPSYTSNSATCAEVWTEAAMVGFCGCLSTVSSFISEADGIGGGSLFGKSPSQLSLSNSYFFFRYVLTSIICAQLLSCLIHGLAGVK